MSVGQTVTSDQINQKLTSLALNMRSLMDQVSDLSLFVNGQGQGMTVLTTIGYNTVPSSSNPGGVSDAALAQSMISYLNTVAGVYFGTATQASEFNFNQELSQLWAGQ